MIPLRIAPKVLQIFDYIITFQQLLNCKLFAPEEIYFSLTSKENQNFVLQEILVAITSLFCRDISSLPIHDFYDNQELILIKVSFELNGEIILRKCWPEIVTSILSSNKYNQVVNKN
jgi:hypothetical protein